jgi:asparagine synthase (glutamine-hydrolysing)
MCGIAGRVNVFSSAPVGAEAIRGMCAWLSHRGPDDEGVLAQGAAGFGHRRLAIIDLSPAGHQPMTSANGRYWITFNGEIYNYRELRARLESAGVRFRTATDTEVLLAAYETYGAACLPMLRGMFAFAIWDTVDRALFLARDRVGKKPLYYVKDRDGIAFASESKAFLADPAFTPRPNLTGLSAYLSLQYVPAPLSAFAGVRTLPPGHYLHATDRGASVHRYWQLAYEPKSSMSEDEATEALLEKLREAVRLRLVSDVPLGAFLSGGVDSSVIVALMCQLGGHRGSVKTFSIGFGEQGFNELPYARRVAEQYGTDHHEFVVQPDIRDVLPRLVAYYGEPFGDSSAIPTYYLSKLTRQHVTVALNGDGGDENLAGYDRYAPNARNAAYQRLPQAVRAPVAAAARWLPAGDPRLVRLRRWTRLQALPEDTQAAHGRFMFDAETKRAVCNPSFLSAAGADAAEAHLVDAIGHAAAEQPLDRLLSMDVETYLPGALLTKVDIATMAFGLEGRSPLLDHEVMEFCAQLPVGHKRQGVDGKRLLKRIGRSLVPAEVIDRPKKGFSVPIEHWFKTDLADTVNDVLLGQRCRERGLLQPRAVERIVKEHRSGEQDWHEQIWILLMLEMWCETYLDQRPRADLVAAGADSVGAGVS